MYVVMGYSYIFNITLTGDKLGVEERKGRLNVEQIGE
jgi:hypothetical protein